MRIETPSLNPFSELPGTGAGRAERRSRGPASTTDVVALSETARASLAESDAVTLGASAVEPIELEPSLQQLWEEARQSLITDPMAPEPGEGGDGPFELSDAEQAVVDELRARDAEVRAHERAHAAIGGGSPTYEYQTGPDGKRYAVGGQVVIDASGGSTEQGTIDRMRQVRASALAPGSPSAQDMAVAAEATQREGAARSRMTRNQGTETVRGAQERLGEQQRAASAFEDQQLLAQQEDRVGQEAWA